MATGESPATPESGRAGKIDSVYGQCPSRGSRAEHAHPAERSPPDADDASKRHCPAGGDGATIIRPCRHPSPVTATHTCRARVADGGDRRRRIVGPSRHNVSVTTLSHTHDGQTWQIPADLIQIQRDFDAANADCHRLADNADTSAYQAARRRRMDAVLALHRHPWLGVEHKAVRAAADRALKDYARAMQDAAN